MMAWSPPLWIRMMVGNNTCSAPTKRFRIAALRAGTTFKITRPLTNSTMPTKKSPAFS